MVLILVASWMSAANQVLNRSLKDVPYSIVLFYHSFFGLVASSVTIAVLLLVTKRELAFLGFEPFENALFFGATAADTIGVMAQTIAF